MEDEYVESDEKFEEEYVPEHPKRKRKPPVHNDGGKVFR